MFVPGNGQESDEASDDEVQNLRESLLRKSRERAIKLKEQERLANDSKSNSNCDSANGNDLESDQELNRELTVKEYENGDEHRFDGESPPMSPESFHRSLIGLPPDQVTIPGAPKNQQCSSSLIEKFAGFHKKMQEGMDMIASIQKNKAFRNPSIYEKLIQFCDIDEFGSNFPIEVYDPHCWKETDYYDYLNKRQQEEMERRAREPKEPRTKVEFISGTAKKASAVSSTSGTVINHTTHSSVPVTLSSSVDKPVRKKSKWDVAGTTGTTTTSGNVGILIRPEIIRPSSEKALQSSTGAMTTTRGNVGILINPEIIRHKSEKPPTTFQLSHR